MEENPALSCRGCLGKVYPDKLYSFAWTEIKDLFEDCTAIKIPPDEHGLPQQICSECYSYCEQWYTFKNMCQDVNEHLQKKSQKTMNVPSEQIRIKEEPEEDDLVEWTGFQDTTDDDLNSYNFGELVPDEEEQAELPVDSSCPLINNAKTSDTDWKCLVCDEMVPQSINLREHLKIHYTEEDPKCPICEESFTRGSKVYPHVIAVHPENRSKRLPVVPAKETPKDNTTQSLKGKLPKLSCPLCSEKHQKLWKHISDAHIPKGQSKQCPVCGKISRNMKNHLVVHTGERPHPCHICGVTFTQAGSRNQHLIAVHKKKGQTKGKCAQKEVGPKKLKVAVETETHSGSVPSRMKGTMPWKTMGYSVSRTDKSVLAQEHNLPTRRRSNTEIPVQKREKKEEVPLNTTRTPRTVKMVECPVCKKHFLKLQQLFIHFVVHTSESPYECVYCKLSFTHRSNFYTHTSKYHPRQPGISGYVIKEGSIFASPTPWELMGYSVSWVDATPTKYHRQSRYRCDQCRMRFASTDDLKGHIETQHKPRRTHPHNCSICAKTFTTKTLVGTHMKKHSEHTLLKLKGRNSKRFALQGRKDTDAKILECQYCEKKYASRRGLQKHFQNHHKEKGTKDEDCESIDSGVVAGQVLGIK